jgi:CRP/FNR family transcriptional regulator/CRP/FNR family nitrogen fixation transcriptional regulator
VTVAAVRRADLARLAATDSHLARALWQMSVRAFQRSEDHAMILARQGATERVAAFLLDYADRVGAIHVLDLPMTRQDMADHLGLTIHTVSRTLSQLQDQGLIEARSTRHVRLLRRDLLERIRA